jgi:hypothetical protein
MHFMMVGRPPPPAAARALDDDLPLLAQLSADGVLPVSAAFCAVIDWCLEFRPQHRPRSVAEVRAALEGRTVPPAPTRRERHPGRGQARAGGRWATTVDVEHPQRPPTRRIARRLPLNRRTLAVAAVPLVLIVAGWALLRGGPSPDEASQPTPQAVSAGTATAPDAEPDGDTAMPVAPSADTPASGIRAAGTEATGTPPKHAAAVPAGARAVTTVTPVSTVTAAPAEAAPPGSGTTRPPDAAPARAAPKERPARPAAKAAAAPTGGARASCGDRSIFTMPMCLRSACLQPEFRQDPECVALATADRRHRESMQRY